MKNERIKKKIKNGKLYLSLECERIKKRYKKSLLYNINNYKIY